MIFNTHSDLAGHHAFLSASKYHWIRYDDEKIAESFHTAMAAREGTELHELAATLITKGIKLPNTQKTLNRYVNDAIGYRMTPELLLLYSANAFGTADAISFRKNKLRVHDLKTGVSKASFDQLLVYCAFFCLEYGFKPAQIEMVLRIYQNDDVLEMNADPMEVTTIMDRVITADKIIERIRAEAMV